MLLQHQDRSWRLVEDRVLIISNGRLDPDELEGSFAFLDALLDQLPRHLLDKPAS